MENIRTETFLGNLKVIVGNKLNDLVLETLGQIYIKTGNSSKTFSELLLEVSKQAETVQPELIVIVLSILKLEDMEYPGDGRFIFVLTNKVLYISYDLSYYKLIEAEDPNSSGYVKRSGDTMTGLLEITSSKAPLVVSSSELVKNFNAEYIGGYSSKDLAKKNLNEIILGEWTFRGKGTAENNWIFKQNIRAYKDFVTSGSLSSPNFVSGFGGYGWRLDSDTGTLTIDNLVVRKILRVYELVVNKINATNGSLWISNSSKCAGSILPKILTETLLQSDTITSLLEDSNYFVPYVDSNFTVVSKTKELSNSSSENTVTKSFVDFKFLVLIKDLETLISNPLFKGGVTLYNEELLTSSWGTFTNEDQVTEQLYNDFMGSILLYYISKERVVTEWNDTTPVSWIYRDTFRKDTPFYVITLDNVENYQNSGYVTEIQPYYKYFAINLELLNNTNIVPNMWIIDTDEEEFPVFKPGDILRCQKYLDGNIKYYDAIVMSQIEDRKFIIQKADSVLDKYTEIEYDENGNIVNRKDSYNNNLYYRTELSFNPYTGKGEATSSNYNLETQEYEPKTEQDRLGDICEGDSLILMGSIQDPQRLNAIYLTSSDDLGPYIDVLSNMNRPDYSVIYNIPKFEKLKVSFRKINSVYERWDSYESGKLYDYYYLTINPLSIDPNNIPTDVIPPTKEFPLVFVKNDSTILINDGEITEITLDILDNPELFGNFVTLTPTKNSKLQRLGEKNLYTYSNTTKVRLGNLDGIINESLGNKQPYGYGLYGENVFLTGEFYLNNGLSVVDFSQDGIILKYKRAGLELVDMYDELGNPIYLKDDSGQFVLDENGDKIQKLNIKLSADEILLNAEKTYIGNKDSGSLFEVIDGKAYIKTDFLRAQEILVDEAYNLQKGEELTSSLLLNPNTITLESLSYVSPVLEPDPYIDVILPGLDWKTTETTLGSTITLLKAGEIDPASPACLKVVCKSGEQVHLVSPSISYGEENEDTMLEKILATLMTYNKLPQDKIKVVITALYKDGSFILIPLLKISDEDIPVITWELLKNDKVSKQLVMVFYYSFIPTTLEDVTIYPVLGSLEITYYKYTINWALWKDGSGSLAQNKIFWDTAGNLTINADIKSSNGTSTIELTHDSNSAALILSTTVGGLRVPIWARLDYAVETETYSTSGGKLYLYSIMDNGGITTKYKNNIYGWRHSLVKYDNNDSALERTDIGSNGVAGNKYSDNSSFLINTLGVNLQKGSKIININPDAGINYSNNLTSSAWPNSRNSVSIGGVYIEEDDLHTTGTLKVRLT